MAQDVVLPQMGESIAEGTITTWLKSVGDRVERDEALFEMSTDKVDAEIPSPAEGVLLEIKVEAGSTVEVGTVVAVIGEEGESTSDSGSGAGEAPAAGAAEVAAQPADAPVAASAATGEESVEDRRRTKSSPLVRKIAAEHGIDVESVPGTGVSGRVTKKDILAFIEKGAAPAAAPVAAQAPAPAAPCSACSQPRLQHRPQQLPQVQFRLALVANYLPRTAARLCQETESKRCRICAQKSPSIWLFQSRFRRTSTPYGKWTLRT